MTPEERRDPFLARYKDILAHREPGLAYRTIRQNMIDGSIQARKDPRIAGSTDRDEVKRDIEDRLAQAAMTTDEFRERWRWLKDQSENEVKRHLSIVRGMVEGAAERASVMTGFNWPKKGKV